MTSTLHSNLPLPLLNTIRSASGDNVGGRTSQHTRMQSFCCTQIRGRCSDNDLDQGSGWGGGHVLLCLCGWDASDEATKAATTCLQHIACNVATSVTPTEQAGVQAKAQ